jgi:hypothetical protein
MTTAVWLRGSPMPARYALLGGSSAGLVGLITGLIIGLSAYPPTALFACVEVGLPAATVGAVLGAAVGVLTRVGHRARPNRSPSS